ncbi:hypothetical protein BGZ73_003056, partial [Actinomortierella ambigua]
MEHGLLAAVSYPKEHITTLAVFEALRRNFDVHTVEAELPGLTYAFFNTQEDYDRATSTPIPDLPVPIRALPVRYSTKKHVNIRAHHLPLMLSDEDTPRELEKLFGEVGSIVDLQRHSIGGIRTTKLDFTLELHDEVADDPDLMLPRVAVIQRRNVLFAWNAGNFCYRCGADHRKNSCPKESEGSLSEQPAVKEPIMARAFPPKEPSPPQTRKAPTPSPNLPIQDEDGFQLVSGRKSSKNRVQPAKPQVPTTPKQKKSAPSSAEVAAAPKNKSHPNKTEKAIPSAAEPNDASMELEEPAPPTSPPATIPSMDVDVVEEDAAEKDDVSAEDV